MTVSTIDINFEPNEACFRTWERARLRRLQLRGLAMLTMVGVTIAAMASVPMQFDINHPTEAVAQIIWSLTAPLIAVVSVAVSTLIAGIIGLAEWRARSDRYLREAWHANRHWFTAQSAPHTRASEDLA